MNYQIYIVILLLFSNVWIKIWTTDFTKVKSISPLGIVVLLFNLQRQNSMFTISTSLGLFFFIFKPMDLLLIICTVPYKTFRKFELYIFCCYVIVYLFFMSGKKLLTYLRTYLPTYLLIYWLTYLLTYWLTDWLTDLFTYLLT